MDTSDRTILKRLLLALIVVVLIGVLIWVFFGRDNKKNATTNTGNSGTSQQNGNQGQPSGGSAAGTPAGQSQAQGGSNNSAAAPAPAATGQQPTQLVETGPGNSVLIFVGSAVVGTIAHALYQKRRRSLGINQAL